MSHALNSHSSLPFTNHISMTTKDHFHNKDDYGSTVNADHYLFSIMLNIYNLTFRIKVFQLLFCKLITK